MYVSIIHLCKVGAFLLNISGVFGGTSVTTNISGRCDKRTPKVTLIAPSSTELVICLFQFTVHFIKVKGE